MQLILFLSLNANIFIFVTKKTPLFQLTRVVSDSEKNAVQKFTNKNKYEANVLEFQEKQILLSLTL